MDLPLVSVCIITYEQPELIYETIDSVLFQDYGNIEIIIADDGSKHFDEQKIREYIEKNKSENIKKVVIFSNSVNVGTVKNINFSIRRSGGDFIKIISGDDTLFDGGVIRNQVEYLRKTNQYLVTSKTQSCDEKLRAAENKRTDKSNAKLNELLEKPYDRLYRIICRRDLCLLVTQASCFSRKFFDEYGLYDERYVYIEDLPMMLRIIRNNIKIGYLDIFGVKHRGNVGISKEQSPAEAVNLTYLSDFIKYTEYEMLPYSHFTGRRFSLNRHKINIFRYKMWNGELKNCGIRRRMLFLLEYLEPMLFYIAYHPAKTGKKVCWFINSITRR